MQSVLIEENILQLPKSFWGQYDISMSFGSVEHFFLANAKLFLMQNSKISDEIENKIKQALGFKTEGVKEKKEDDK